jgi:hypothetical protein
MPLTDFGITISIETPAAEAMQALLDRIPPPTELESKLTARFAALGYADPDSTARAICMQADRWTGRR